MLFVTAKEQSMNEGVTNQEIATPEKEKPQEGLSDKEINFRRLEAAREIEREARVRAEMQAEAMRNELEEIKKMLQPKETDPLDDAEDYVDPARLRAKLEKERAHFKKEAREIAKQTVREEREQEEKRNFLQRLKGQFSDYDQVMNEANIANLEKADPVFIETVLQVPDDYTRRLTTYKKLKSMQQVAPKTEEKAPSIKERVEENAKNPYYIAPSVATPSGVDFDVKSKEARTQAYEKLKAAQRRPVGNAAMPSRH
jgi:hypothetical protein